MKKMGSTQPESQEINKPSWQRNSTSEGSARVVSENGIIWRARARASEGNWCETEGAKALGLLAGHEASWGASIKMVTGTDVPWKADCGSRGEDK